MIKGQFYIVLFILALIISSCADFKKNEAFKRFNEGTAISLEAADALESGNQVHAKQLYLQANEQFTKTLIIDPSHPGVASAIGYNFYQIQQFNDAADWLRKAINQDSSFSLNYQLLGLSQINEGLVDEGDVNLKMAFELEQDDDFKLRTIENLVHIGQSAFVYGESSTDPKIQVNYKKFGIRVLISAFQFSGHSIAVGKLIDECAKKMDDKALSDWAKALMYTQEYGEYH